MQDASPLGAKGAGLRQSGATAPLLGPPDGSRRHRLGKGRAEGIMRRHRGERDERVRLLRRTAGRCAAGCGSRLLRHRAGQSQVTGERGSRDAGRRLLRGRRGLLHGAALRAGAPLCHRHQADGGEDPPARGRGSAGVRPRGLHPCAGGSHRGGHLAAGLCAPGAGLLHLRPGGWHSGSRPLRCGEGGDLRTDSGLHEPGRLGQRDPLRPAGQEAEG